MVLQPTLHQKVNTSVFGAVEVVVESNDLQAAHTDPTSGDFAALESHDLPILRVHLGADPDAGLAALERALSAALDTTTEA